MDTSSGMTEGAAGPEAGSVSSVAGRISHSPGRGSRNTLDHVGAVVLHGTPASYREHSSPHTPSWECPDMRTVQALSHSARTVYSLPVSPRPDSRQQDPYHSPRDYPPLQAECSADALLPAPESYCQRVNSESGASSSPGSQSQTTRESGLTPVGRPSRTERPRLEDYSDHYPDGGWGWVVCGGAFVAHFLCHGVHLAGGVLCKAIAAKQGIDTVNTIWLGSLSYGLSFLFWPLITIICRRKSVRVVAMLGGLISSMGFLFMSFSFNLEQIAASMVVLALGTGMTLCTSSLIVGRYFQKRRECAEMLILCGSGVGMAVLAVYTDQIVSLLIWSRAMQGIAGILFASVIAGGLYRSATLYHPRRSAILYLRTRRMTSQQRQEFKSKKPYMDFSSLHMRSVQTLMFSSFLISLGIHVPYLLLPHFAAAHNIEPRSVILLTVFMGVAFAFGSLITGLIVIRSSLRCMIARQYLCQIPSFASGLILLLFTMADGFKAFVIFVWLYGLCCGAYVYSLKVYAYEQVTVKLMERAWSFLVAMQAVPLCAGPPIAWYLNSLFPVAQGGILFSAGCMILGSLLLSCMTWASKHKSNNDVIQMTHLRSKAYEEDIQCLESHRVRGKRGYASSASGSSSSQRDYHGDHRPWSYPSNRMPVTSSDEDRWSDIEAMSPMSPTDKVTEFLVYSQSMIQNYSEIQHIEIPNVRLEVKSEYASNTSDTVLHRETIKDIKLEAVIRRNSPKRRKSIKSTTSSRDRLKDSPHSPKAMRTKINSAVDHNHRGEGSVLQLETHPTVSDHMTVVSVDDSPTVTTEKMTTV